VFDDGCEALAAGREDYALTFNQPGKNELVHDLADGFLINRLNFEKKEKGDFNLTRKSLTFVKKRPQVYHGQGSFKKLGNHRSYSYAPESQFFDRRKSGQLQRFSPTYQSGIALGDPVATILHISAEGGIMP